MVAQPRVEMAGGRAVSPPRLEIAGMGEEEVMVELEELVQGGIEDEDVVEADGAEDQIAEAPILGPQERRVRGVAPGERGELADRLDPEVPGPILGPLPKDASGWSNIDTFDRAAGD